MIADDLQEALDAIDMEWLMQREGITYKISYGRSGKQLQLRECPFCFDGGYKTYVNAETGIGNCFHGSCQKGTFNKWSLIKALYHDGKQLISMVIKQLAREQGWRPKIAVEKFSIADINTLQLPKSTEAWLMAPYPEYLARRAIFPELAEYFRLYWCEKGWWEYEMPDGSIKKQNYSGRVLLPVFDLNGVMVSFQGRDITGEAELRYVFPPGFASSGTFLYNGFNVTEKTKTVVICEGVFDVMKMKRALNSDAKFEAWEPIGTFGMHLSSGHPDADDQVGRLNQLRMEKGVTDVVFAWDGEQKAILAAIDQALALQARGFNCRIALLPDGKDPADCNVPELTSALEKAVRCRSKLDAVKIKSYISRSYKTK